MLDITNKETIFWLRHRLEKLMNSLTENEETEYGKKVMLPDVVFFVDAGTSENLPTYFQVCC